MKLILSSFSIEIGPVKNQFHMITLPVPAAQQLLGVFLDWKMSKDPTQNPLEEQRQTILTVKREHVTHGGFVVGGVKSQKTSVSWLFFFQKRKKVHVNF